MTPVSSGQLISDNVGVFQWKFYTFAVPPQGTHSLSVHMKTIGTGVSTLLIYYPLTDICRLSHVREHINNT